MDVTEEFFAWLQENDYDKKEKKIKEKKTKTASDKEQEL